MSVPAPAHPASASARSVKLSATVGGQGIVPPPRSIASTFSSVTMPVPEVDVTLERNSWVTIQGHVEVQKRSRRSLKGLWADLGVQITEEDIEKVRREMWSGFPRKDI